MEWLLLPHKGRQASVLDMKDGQAMEEEVPKGVLGTTWPLHLWLAPGPVTVACGPCAFCWHLGPGASLWWEAVLCPVGCLAGSLASTH